MTSCDRCALYVAARRDVPRGLARVLGQRRARHLYVTARCDMPRRVPA